MLNKLNPSAIRDNFNTALLIPLRKTHHKHIQSCGTPDRSRSEVQQICYVV